MTEREWMEQTLALGALGDAATSPNPRVGCLVVREGVVVGRGYHRAAGLPHAESLALAEAGALARGATLYVNLEPCAHHGRTPPCADLIVERGVRRVVAAIQDPNPLVDGRGFARLRGAGIEVTVGLMAEESRRLNDPFLHFHLEGRPLVTLKAAASLDGVTAATEGRARWISGEASRRFAHRLRLRHDAVLVGANTVRRDDPRLTVRLAGIREARWRCVLAPTLDLDPRARLFRVEAGERPARIYAAADAPCGRDAEFAGRAEIVRVPRRGGALDLDAVLADLARLGVQSLLVEGGARTHAAFLDACRADRLVLFLAPALFGARGAVPIVDRAVTRGPESGIRVEELLQLSLGGDLALVGRLAPPGSAER